MNERDRQLERLRTLRDSGALTDEEFGLEVARLAGTAPARAAAPEASAAPAPVPTPAQAQAPAPAPAPPAPPSANTRRLNPLLIALPVAAIGIAILAYFLIVGRGQTGATANATANAGQAKPAAPSEARASGAASMRDRPEAEQLDTAFRAVFGQASPARQTVGESQGNERAARVVWTGFGPVLLTERSIPDGGHSELGYIGAYYLRDTGTGFEIASRHPEAAPGWGFGQAPRDWRIADNFTTNPAIYAEGGTLFQGYATAAAHIVELRPEGPSLSSIDLGADNSGADVSPDDAQDYEGAIRNVVKDQSFDVVYTGTCEFTRRFVFRDNKFEPEDGLVPECAG